MMDLELSPEDSASQQSTIPSDPKRPKVGEWFWVKDNGEELLGCVVKIGSNHVILRGPSERYEGTWSDRIHFDEFEDLTRPEPNHESVIRSKIDEIKRRIKSTMGEIEALTSRLCLAPHSLPSGSSPSETLGSALAPLSSDADPKTYRSDLERAKKKTLPELFQTIEEENKAMIRWMSADAIPLEAFGSGLETLLNTIDDRIFNVSLYAGLAEETVQCRTGDPAPMDAPIHLMQRLLFMDEECLLNYRSGGFEFRDIDEFDAWISEPDNMTRILPFPRCLVSMKVRRNAKDRDFDGSYAGYIRLMQLRDSDKMTFLYFRNGDNLWRLSTDLEFGDSLDPERAEFDPSEPMMVRFEHGDPAEVVGLGEYEARKKIGKEEAAAREHWNATHDRSDWWHNPHQSSFFERYWHPFLPSDLYYDEMVDLVAKRMQKYNRIAVILQGLLDRSMVFHPHPKISVWDPESFARHIVLIYDGAGTLTHGDTPDIDAYIARCNASLTAESIVTGQRDYWMEKEAEKENEKRRRFASRNGRVHYAEAKKFKPEGNPGPGLVSTMTEWKPRAKRAVFAWKRDRRPWSHRPELVPCSLSVPVSRLFNVSAYRPGDFRQFFDDPRTRALYLKWAPMLLVAEEFHAGNVKLKMNR